MIRAAAIEYVRGLEQLAEGLLPRTDLERGFEFEGHRVPVIGQQGIFKPKVLKQVPLSIYTTPPKEGQPRPYDDQIGEDGLIRYRYRRQGGPDHHENVGLRLAMARRTPLIYFHGVAPGRYLAAYPVFIVGDDPKSLTFTVAADDARLISTLPAEAVSDDEAPGRRRYITRAVVQRLHQQDFRVRVLNAYRESCAVCRLRHSQLLDAAHIVPDSHPKGDPWISNGLCLCKIHHAAFDANILGINPSGVIEIREDILEEIDGPMLEHGLKELHKRPLIVTPSKVAWKPDPERLEIRYEQFRRAV